MRDADKAIAATRKEAEVEKAQVKTGWGASLGNALRNIFTAVTQSAAVGQAAETQR